MPDRSNGGIMLQIRIHIICALSQEAILSAGILGAEAGKVVITELIDRDQKNELYLLPRLFLGLQLKKSPGGKYTTDYG